ncbi:MAG: DUF4239 domain-containing protein [Deltaproteobacteria bacterium]|nr:DUF4239 domain-containing protein [Deltaproteobacteria bacterium]
MSQFQVFAVAAVLLFFGMLAAMEVGYRLGRRHAGLQGSDARAGLAASEAAVFGLLGLLLAFTFGGAASRREDRRRLIADEANAIGTAWLRLDLLAPPGREVLRADFRRYLDTRLAAYAAVPDLRRARTELDSASRLQGVIWTRALAACRAEEQAPPCLLLLPALNAMIDVTGLREMVLMSHPPEVVFWMLFLLALLSALLAGFGMPSAKGRSLLHMVVFAAMTSVVIYVVIDLEYPRLGLIRIDSADQMLVELRRKMG